MIVTTTVIFKYNMINKSKVHFTPCSASMKLKFKIQLKYSFLILFLQLFNEM